MKSMDEKGKVLMTLFLIIIIGFSFMSATKWISKTTGKVIDANEQVMTALCLGEKNSLLYISKTCTDCDAQKRVFGSAIRLIDTVDCTKSNENCPSEDSLPAWKINDKVYYGLTPLEKLNEIAGC